MTDTINASPSLKRVSNERCRDKAALLENNLFNLITKQNDPISCRFQINRDKYPDAAIVKGTPPIPSRNGAIGKAFLPPESSPGLLDQNGAIDFKETNKYPIVQTGDNLFFITPAFQGRPGIAYDGSILEVGEALPFDIELKGGVDHMESLDSEGNSIGYFLRAAKTGVAVLIRTDGKITSLEITDKLKIKRLDYSTGNIGSTVICPISIKLDTLVQTPKVTMDLQRRRAELVKVMAQIDKNISAISLTFEGTLRRAASLRIYAGKKKERPGQPEIFIESKNDNDDFIKITAAYDKQKGIIFTCT